MHNLEFSSTLGKTSFINLDIHNRFCQLNFFVTKKFFPQITWELLFDMTKPKKTYNNARWNIVLTYKIVHNCCRYYILSLNFLSIMWKEYSNSWWSNLTILAPYKRELLLWLLCNIVPYAWFRLVYLCILK